MKPRASRLRKLCYAAALVAVVLMVVGAIFKAPAPADTSAYCGPRWHPEVYCTPGYVGPLYHLVLGRKGEVVSK